jgi:hypothetical protein
LVRRHLARGAGRRYRLPIASHAVHANVLQHQIERTAREWLAAAQATRCARPQLALDAAGVELVLQQPDRAVESEAETVRSIFRRYAELGMNEVFAVARSRAIALADTIVAETMTFLDSLAADGTTSLQRDIVDGKPSELEY